MTSYDAGRCAAETDEADEAYDASRPSLVGAMLA